MVKFQMKHACVLIEGMQQFLLIKNDNTLENLRKNPNNVFISLSEEKKNIKISRYAIS